MNVSLYQAAAAMNANQRWQELISDNLAATSAPGARKQDVIFSLIPAGNAAGVSGANNEAFAIPAARAATDFTEGQMNPTGTATDFAIDGPAFFQVQLPKGGSAYTRDGSFQVSATGQLVTQQGYPVQSDSGSPVQLDPTSSAAITVSATGDVSQGGEIKGRIRLTEFQDVHQLETMGGGYFLANNAAAKPGPAKSSQLRQGYLEAGNASPTVEMASLLTAMRMFESNQKVIENQDERMGRVISDLGGTGS